jgi:hypothetical protein
VNIRNISYADIATCVINVGQSVSDYTGTDGLNWFSAIGPDLSGLPYGLSMLRQQKARISLGTCSARASQASIEKSFKKVRIRQISVADHGF